MLDAVLARARSASGALAGVIFTLASAALGLVWLSIAAVQTLALSFGPVAAAAVVGAVLMLPALVTTVLRKSTDRSGLAMTTAVGPTGPLQAQLDAATQLAGRVAQDSPLFALGFAHLCGVASVLAPAALAPLLGLVNAAATGEKVAPPDGGGPLGSQPQPPLPSS